MSPLLFIVYLNWIDKCSQTDECVTIGNCKISRLQFADDLVLLCSTESGLQRALKSFADACNAAVMKISTAKTEVIHLSRNPDQCVLQVKGATLKQVEWFKYLGVAFTSDERQDEGLHTQIDKASAVMRALHYSVVMKQNLSIKTKLSIFKPVFVPILTYGRVFSGYGHEFSCADSRRNSLVNARVSISVEIWQKFQGLANRCDFFQYSRKEIASNVRNTEGHHSLVFQKKYMPKAYK